MSAGDERAVPSAPIPCDLCGTATEIRRNAIGRTHRACPKCNPRSLAQGYRHPDDAMIPQTLVRAPRHAVNGWDTRDGTVGAMLRAARLEAGITQTELARRSGLAGGSSITQMERDYQTGHNTRVLARIAETLGCRLILVFERRGKS